MINRFYRCMVYLSRKWGIWIFYVAVWIIATGYFLFFPYRVATSVRFYRALFPQHSRLYALWCAWKQFHDFTSIYIDRYLLEASGNIEYTAEGLEHLREAADNNTGGILLMSHLGNWEVAARLLKKEGFPLLLFMGKKAGEQIEDLQKNNLQKAGVEIIASQRGAGSPVEILEGVRYMRNGWILSMAGDRFGDSGRSFVEVEFLGHVVRLPETPYVLSMATGAPIFVFFAFRKARGKYHFIIHPPIDVRAGSRQQRKQGIHRAARAYARLLEKTVYRHPFQWHHFEPFLGQKTGPEDQSSLN
ncbi:MAG: lysophospholipid acyltransferase family protein [Desulfosalsimonas sp.]|uniref:LpxL/LpxP family acyltransferase n=1 Tax=Desulfosalsimonas sp. TaxID=3073848 RepID=UPI0039709D6C